MSNREFCTLKTFSLIYFNHSKSPTDYSCADQKSKQVISIFYFSSSPRLELSMEYKHLFFFTSLIKKLIIQCSGSSLMRNELWLFVYFISLLSPAAKVYGGLVGLLASIVLSSTKSYYINGAQNKKIKQKKNLFLAIASDRKLLNFILT